MNKGIFSIPVYDQHIDFHKILDETTSYVLEAEKLGLNEAFFGEHIADKHEKITSSLMMVSSLSSLTKNIKLGTLTTNLNFYNPSVAASLISMADNLCKGRLILGIGSGANISDIEAIGFLEKDNYKIMHESFSLIIKILESKDFIDLKSENFKLSTNKTGNRDLGLGFFNPLYENRKNLEIIMPVLNKDSYNVKICAENNWSIAISNFCCEKLIENHIENYLKFSKLVKKDALKKIKLLKLIHAIEDAKDTKKYSFDENSPFIKVINTLFKKLKTFNKHQIFGEEVTNLKEAVNNTLLAGTPATINKYIDRITQKYGEIGSFIYVTPPKTGYKHFDKSLELFANNVKT
jgi:alkanesulfonate monooxygenase SsuD/methylene tetrahydromethanopterin reductase-like flavin-dependent oxidoreductase (luciferase family)